MPQAQATKKQPRRKSILRGVTGDLRPRPVNPAETLFEFVKILENIPADSETVAFNSKYMRAPDGSLIEY